MNIRYQRPNFNLRDPDCHFTVLSGEDASHTQITETDRCNEAAIAERAVQGPEVCDTVRIPLQDRTSNADLA